MLQIKILHEQISFDKNHFFHFTIVNDIQLTSIDRSIDGVNVKLALLFLRVT